MVLQKSSIDKMPDNSIHGPGYQDFADDDYLNTPDIADQTGAAISAMSASLCADKKCKSVEVTVKCQGKIGQFIKGKTVLPQHEDCGDTKTIQCPCPIKK